MPLAALPASRRRGHVASAVLLALSQVGQFAAAGASLAGSQAYDPWGNVTATSGSVTGLLGYQSAWTDAASGKDLMGARWYNPGAGDFTSADTVSVSPDPDPAAGNPFAYAADEPLDLVDPTGHYIVPPGGPDGAGTSERVGNGVTSPNNWIADVATARVVEQAVIEAPNDAAKAAAAHAAVARVEAEQATARKAAVAAAAKEKAAQARARQEAEARAAAAKKTAEQAAARKAAAQRAAAARAPAFAAGCSPRMLNYGACPSESGAAGTTSAQVKQSFIGAAMVLTSVIPVGDVIGGIAGIFDAGDAAADATEATEAERTATSAAEAEPTLLRAGGRGARLPMNMDTVNSVADKHGIDVSGNDISINKSIAGLRGSTAPDGSITLYRGAFENEQQLAQTLIHEQYHVADLQAGLPYPTTYDAGSAWEQAAEDFANDWWASLGG